MIWNVINTLLAVVALVWTVMNSRSIEKRDKLTLRPMVVLKDKRISSDLITIAQYGLFFINIGKSAAINVDIPDEYLAKYSFLRKWRDIRRELAPDGEETMCASGPERHEKLIKDLVINYEDSAGIAYSTILKNGRIQFK
jgi:hypothetical protein